MMNLSTRRMPRRPASRTVNRLSVVPLGEAATVVGLDVDLDAQTARRLYDLGFTAGTNVRVVRTSPLGGPRIYRVDDYELALRAQEASLIEVEPTS